MARWPRSRTWRGAPPGRSEGVWTPDSAWHVVYARDLTDGIDHDFLTDGSTVDIDGITWTAENNDGSGAATFGFTDGAGLEIEPASSTTWAPPTRTAPLVQVNLTDFMADYDVYDRLLLQLRIDAATLSEDGQQYGIVVGSEDHANDGYDGGIGAAWASSAEQLRSYVVWGSGVTTDDVAMGQPPVLAIEWCGPSFSTAYDTVDRWSRPGQLTTAAPGYAANNSAPRTSTWPWSASTVALRVWASRGSGVAAFTATVTGMRILRQRW